MEQENKTFDEMLNERMEKFMQWHTRDKAAFIKALREAFGDEVYKVVEKQESERTKRRWTDLAKNNGSNSIEDLIKLLWEQEGKRGLEYTIEHKENGGVQMKCTRCPYYEFAKENNIEEEMLHMMCAMDPYIVEGFNPNMGFKRTKTFMEGHDCCDHYYYMKD